MQTISCYGLLSPNPILNTQLTGKTLILPFFHGCRYAAIPATRSDGNIQVDIMTARPESLIYHIHCLHLVDLKVLLSLSFLHFYMFFFQIPQHMKDGKVSQLQPMSISVQSDCTSSANTVSKEHSLQQMEVNLSLFLFPFSCSFVFLDFSRYPVW